MDKYEELKQYIEKEFGWINETTRDTDHDRGYVQGYQSALWLIMNKIGVLERRP